MTTHIPPSSSSTCSCVPSGREIATSSLPILWWVPQHELREQWADFGAEALSSVALASTGHAFLALSWEANALRHYNKAWYAHQQGFTTNARTFHLRASDALTNAHRCWSTVQDWLERLINNRALCVSDDDVEQVRTLIHDTVEQQSRLAALMQQLEQERLDDALAATPLASAHPPYPSSAQRPWHSEQKGGA